MAQNTFQETGFSEEDATVLALEADSAAALAQFIQLRFPGNQKAAAKHLRLHQSEISALLAGNLGRFSLSKLIRIARRAGVRLYLDMGDDAKGANAITLRPTIVGNVSVEQLVQPEAGSEGGTLEVGTPRAPSKSVVVQRH